MNEALCAPYSEKEISDVLFQIGPLKAPGADGFLERFYQRKDGFLARFYQRNWVVLRKEIVDAVPEFFVLGVMPVGVNDTAIVLISKVPHPKELKEF